MDIVGPLPRSSSGNRYVLVICDYATRYPEAVPMRAVDAESLLYGREVRGPLYVLQESWVARERNTESVVSHVLAIRERMEQMSSLVKESLEKAQQSQKACPVARALQGYQAEDRFGRLKREFAQVLANTPGRTQFAEHCIETGSARPVRLPAYRIPHADRETVRQEIEEMLEEGILVHSNSEWSSPIVLVGKKDGSLRLCVDYRRLNSLSEADAYPMPRIDEMLEQLGTARFISTLDLTRGYWQVPVAKEARHKTAFVTPFGLYHFNVMPFGLQGAPCYTFQRLMEGVIRVLRSPDFKKPFVLQTDASDREVGAMLSQKNEACRR
ncbi:hypothetical protein EMCRGX_G002722 [Ephydatia muelleri]